MSFQDTRKEKLAGTGRWTAAIRARESERSDRLFNDPLAALLAGEEGQQWLDASTSEQYDPRLRGELDIDPSTASIIVRVRFFDDFVARVVTEHDVRQVVVLAAGMDTRAYRLSWPAGTPLFEIDQPRVIELKERLLASAGAVPACQRQSIGVDLSDPWSDALQRAGFDPGQRSLWLLEGFLPYLPEPGVARLFDEISALAAPGSWLGCDTVNREMLTSPWTRPWIERLASAGISWLSGIDEPEALLGERGWSVTVIQYGEEGANFGRWPFPPMPPRSVPGIPRNFLVTATRSAPA
jgi:methyltransferase (TIGR00027 family)